VSRVCVALLRGINVGRARRLAMADLRELVTKLGYGDVRTLLNSGNIAFTVPGSVRGDAAGRIEKAIAARLGVSARVTVLTAAEMGEVVGKNPLGKVADDPSRFLVAVLSNPADRALLKPLTKQDWKPEALALGARVAYLWCAGGILESRLWTAIGRILGDGVTSRNWSTMSKLEAIARDLS
jgi:uncharacterized protein (DUF1697 family)